MSTGTKFSFTLRWILGTVVGWTLALLSIIPGVGIWEIFTSLMWQHFREADWYQLGTGWLGNTIFALLVLLTLILMGIALGLAQWQIALRDRIAKRVWVFSTALIFVTGIIGFIAGSSLSPPTFSSQAGAYSGFDTRLIVNNNWLITAVLVGGILGFTMGLPQWLILRRYFSKASYWLLATIGGGITALIALIISIYIVKNAVLASTLSCCLSPIAFASVTGITLYNLMRRTKDSSI